jgi:hypothetical protein
MGAEGMMSQMNQSIQDNKNLRKGRKKMAENPYATQDISLEKRNPTLYLESRAHRFWRRSVSKTITRLYYLILGLIVLCLLAYYFFMQ